MVSVLAWTIGDASSLSCQPLSQAHFLYSTTSSGIVTWSKCNTVNSCGTTGKVAIMEPPISWFHALPFVGLRSGASLVLCMYRSCFGNAMVVETNKIDAQF